MIRFFNVHYPIRGLILPTGEGFVAITSFFIAIWIRFGAQSQVVLSQQQAFAKIFSVSVVGLACSYFCDPYTPERHGSQGESYCNVIGTHRIASADYAGVSTESSTFGSKGGKFHQKTAPAPPTR